MKNLQPLVAELRVRHGLSQSEIARRVGCAPSYVCMIDGGQRGARPAPALLAKFVRVVNEARAEAGLKRRIGE